MQSMDAISRALVRKDDGTVASRITKRQEKVEGGDRDKIQKRMSQAIYAARKERHLWKRERRTRNEN